MARDLLEPVVVVAADLAEEVVAAEAVAVGAVVVVVAVAVVAAAAQLVALVVHLEARDRPHLVPWEAVHRCNLPPRRAKCLVQPPWSMTNLRI